MAHANMGNAAYIAGDWGTTLARFWLCTSSGEPVERRDGKGVASFEGDQAAIMREFDELTKGWSSDLPAVLCGMVGSMTGWHDSGYASCPADCRAIATDGIRLTHRNRNVLLLPGLTVRNRVGEPDVMRGEETQLVGAIDMIGSGTAIVILPGTHNKWCVVEDGQVKAFHTAMTGELHATLRNHSVLIGKTTGQVGKPDAFEDGVKTAYANKDAGLESLLFTTRSRQAVGELDARDAEEYLSGVLIGSDVATASTLYAPELASAPLFLICSAPLGERYQRALAIRELEATRLSGAETALRGLLAAYRATFAS